MDDFDAGVSAAIQALQRWSDNTRSDRVPIRVATSELESITRHALQEQERTRADIAEQALTRLATRVVDAAREGMEHAAQDGRQDESITATVNFGYAETMQWARFAAAKKHPRARQLIAHAETRRAPAYQDETEREPPRVRVSPQIDKM